MIDEEKKVDEVVEEDDDGFTDVKPVIEEKNEEVAAEAVEETKPEEPEVAMNLVEEEPAPNADEAFKVEMTKDARGNVVSYTYPDENLKAIEDSRYAFFKGYKGTNTIKWAVTMVLLAIIVACWLIPTFFDKESFIGKNQMYITIAGLVLSLVGLWLMSHFIKKKTDANMKAYFKTYYEKSDAYVYGDAIENKTGDVDTKLDQQVMIDANLYENIYKVGSRNCINFDYNHQHVVFADSAAQVRGAKALQTVFVGKFLMVDNDWNGEDLIIYLKGNKRALPPTTLHYYELLEDSKYMVAYGPKTTKKFLTKRVRDALADIKTNKTLVDVAISVRRGKTYIALGYEDDLMILPMDKPFNPSATMQLREDTKKVLALLDAMNSRHE